MTLVQRTIEFDVPPGEQGPPGIQGATGLQGPQGVQGPPALPNVRPKFTWASGSVTVTIDTLGLGFTQQYADLKPANGAGSVVAFTNGIAGAQILLLVENDVAQGVFWPSTVKWADGITVPNPLPGKVGKVQGFVFQAYNDGSGVKWAGDYWRTWTK